MIQETRRKLKQLKLSGMLRAWDALVATGADKQCTIDELLAQLVDAETETRYVRVVARNIAKAKFRQRALIADFECGSARGLDKLTMSRLAECEWIRKKENLIVTGATGTGKSFLACALGYVACTKEYRVQYFSAAKLLRLLRESVIDHSISRLIKSISKCHVLLIDDFGLEKIAQEERRWLLEIMEDRYGNSSTVIVSQFPKSFWPEIIGDPTIADAIIDRLIHNAQNIELVKEECSRRARGLEQKKPVC